jgi:hypothetical protein
VWFVADKPADLRGQVGGLVQAMAAFGGGEGGGAAVPKLDLPGNGQSGAGIVGMVDVLKQFDANGQQIGNALGSAASTSQPLGISSIRNSAEPPTIPGGRS